jgi:hypothetical protein
MDRRERRGDHNAAMLAMLDGWQTGLWTALPGVVQSFDPVKKTCVVLPALKASVMKPDGSSEWVTLPLLLDCPVVFPSGGGVTLTFPIVPQDECLVVFASRCIDAWWQNGCPLNANGRPDAQVQAEFRMHDLSDGFVIVGISSVPKVQPAISTSAAEMRSTDGTKKFSLNPTTGEVKMVTDGASVKVTPNRVDLDGVLYINGAAYLAHKHTGIEPGGGQSGGVA